MKKRFLINILLVLFLTSCCSAQELSVAKTKNVRNAICEEAKTYLGCPYRSGGIGPNSFDCSGLVYAVYKDVAGINLPRSTRAMYSAVKKIKKSELKKGDLVFFITTGGDRISHVGIYIGNNEVIHAASAGSKTGVIISSLKEKYYVKCYAASARVPGLDSL